MTGGVYTKLSHVSVHTRNNVLFLLKRQNLLFPASVRLDFVSFGSCEQLPQTEKGSQGVSLVANIHSRLTKEWPANKAQLTIKAVFFTSV